MATVLLLGPRIAVAQTPPSEAACDAVCQVNNALKESTSDKTSIGSRAGNTGTMQQKKTGPIIPGAIASPPAATK